MPGGGEDDRDLWRRVTRDVAPLPARVQKKKRTDRPAVAAPDAPSSAPAPGPAAKPRRRAVPTASAPPPPPPKPGPMTHGAAPGLDRRTQVRLRRGQVEIEGRMDLHGLTQAEAHRALNAFVSASYEAGRRAVLVITGKGLRESGEIGVLRRAVPDWLNTPPLSSMVRAFSHAAPKDGGQGALYVLLKRKRAADGERGR